MNEIFEKYGLIILTIIIFGVFSYAIICGMTDPSGLESEDGDVPDSAVFLKSYGNFSQEGYDTRVMLDVINMSNPEHVEYMGLQGGPLVGYGLSYKGHIEIWWNKDTEVNESTMDRIYSIWNKNGKLVGIEDIPVVFLRCSKYEGD
ncbi:hypothetical protein [Methanogenium organophilum]|uniref:Uncharacterized protein n=1 Tax=Methanogenium organophilum TaxID=2199 RepID=A0A9X9S3U8_METOG|nr:hypothetical protein [Methanogenium organophilum]WAI01454.1 hypothetical protein OU421_00865 [Methanogenium organophilum]